MTRNSPSTGKSPTTCIIDIDEFVHQAREYIHLVKLDALHEQIVRGKDFRIWEILKIYPRRFYNAHKKQNLQKSSVIRFVYHGQRRTTRQKVIGIIPDIKMVEWNFSFILHQEAFNTFPKNFPSARFSLTLNPESSTSCKNNALPSSLCSKPKLYLHDS